MGGKRGWREDNKHLLNHHKTRTTHNADRHWRGPIKISSRRIGQRSRRSAIRDWRLVLIGGVSPKAALVPGQFPPVTDVISLDHLSTACKRETGVRGEGAVLVSVRAIYAGEWS